MYDFEIYTDGGYSMQADLGAFAYVILQNGEEIKRFSQKIEHETNNRAEIKAIMGSVLSLPKGSSAIAYSDSQYALGVLSGKYKAKKNTDLVEFYRLSVRKLKLKVKYEWVRGHNGNKWNEVCDQLCNEAAGLDLNKNIPKKEKGPKDLRDMGYNELVELFKAVKEELVRRHNEIGILIKE